MLPIPYTTQPPGFWLRPAGHNRWCFTKDVERARNERNPEPPILSLLTKFRPAIIFACEEALQDPLHETIPAVPLYTYKGSKGEAWVKAMPNLFNVPAHSGCSLVLPCYGDFGRMFVFKKSWLHHDYAQLFTTVHHDTSPICHLSDAMMQQVIDNFAVYLSKMAGLPMEESD